MLSIKLLRLVFCSIQLKHQNLLFQYRSEATETNCETSKLAVS
jgi:hypothetical protein